jgi:hypothetical protein
MPEPHDVSYIGRTNFRREAVRFGIKQRDRLSHLYILGKTGVGKSSLLETLARQDLADGRGFGLIDPHGDLVARLAQSLTPAERERVIYLDATNPTQPYGYNPLRRVRADKVALAASGLIETLRKLWPLAWGVRMEHVLRNSLYVLLELDGSTLPDILRLYTDKSFREAVTRQCTNPVVRDFWRREFANYLPRQAAEAVAPIQNKLGALLSDPMLYRTLVRPSVDLHFRQLMDEGKVLVVNLSKGQIGEDSALTLGSLLVSTLGLAAFGRAGTAEAERRPFFLYIDEFQSFTTLSFVNLWAEIRKSGIGVMAANQYLAQLDPDIRHAVLGNAGTLISFRTGPEDAVVLAREFQPVFGVEDVMNLPNHNFYVKLMIEGAPSRPFSGVTIDPKSPSQ